MSSRTRVTRGLKQHEFSIRRPCQISSRSKIKRIHWRRSCGYLRSGVTPKPSKDASQSGLLEPRRSFTSFNGILVSPVSLLHSSDKIKISQYLVSLYIHIYKTKNCSKFISFRVEIFGSCHSYKFSLNVNKISNILII